jgi:tetratricopeptide (TPR) repeat protein
MAKKNTSKNAGLSTSVIKAAEEAARQKKSFNPKALYAALIAMVLLTSAGMLIDYYTAWGNTPKLIKRMLESAEKNAIYKHYSEAESAYGTIISRFGNKETYKEDVKQARLSLAKTYKDAEQYLKAISLYTELAVDYKASNPDMYAWLQLELADCYNSILNSDEAIRVDQKIVDDFKNTDWAAEALFGIADAYKSKKDYPNALKYYDMIINKYEKGFLSAEALTNKGRIYEELGKDSLAYKVYGKVVKEFPEIVTEYARLRYDALSVKTAK